MCALSFVDDDKRSKTNAKSPGPKKKKKRENDKFLE